MRFGVHQTNGEVRQSRLDGFEQRLRLLLRLVEGGRCVRSEVLRTILT